MNERSEPAELLVEAALLMKSLNTYGAMEAIFRLRALTELSERLSTTTLLNIAADETLEAIAPAQHERRAA